MTGSGDDPREESKTRGTQEHEGERDEDVGTEADVQIPNHEPTPGVTAPLDDVADEEKDLEPVGVMPGAGPDEDAKPGRAEKETSEAVEGSEA